MKNPFVKKERPMRLHQLLGTKDEAQQVALVNALAQPTIIVTITLAPYDGHLTIGAQSDHGGQVHPDLVYRMLDMARLRVQEIEKEQRMAAPSAEAPTSAPGPTPEQETVSEDRPKPENGSGGPSDETAGAVASDNGHHAA